jgi:FixJ family two-component response regulator
MLAKLSGLRPADAAINRMAQAPTVFIVDNEIAARDSLGKLVRHEGWQAECFATAEEFLARPRSMMPGCLLMDVSLPDIDGLALQQIVADRMEMPVVFVTGRRDVWTTVRAMKAGAVDFLTKPASTPAVLDALRRAFEQSQRVLTEEASACALRTRYALLTRREREVMNLVISGRLNKQIAGELAISEITVKVHRCNMKRKMGADSLAALVRMATKLGLRVRPDRTVS